MTSKTKKIIIALLVIFSTLSVVYLYLSISKTPPPKEPGFLPQIITPSIPPLSVEFIFPKDLKLDIPAKLNIYSLQNLPLTSDQANSLAQSLSFSSNPQIINDPIYGPTYIWSEEDKALVIKLRDRIISYTTYPDFSTLQIGFNLSQERIFENTNTFINPFNQYSNLKLTPSRIIYYLAQGDEQRGISQANKANTADVEISTSINNLPVIGVLNSTIGIDNSARPITAEITLPPQSLADSSSRDTLTLDELEKNISSAKLINIDNPTTLEPLSDLLTGKIEINTIYLAYYQYSQQTSIQPVFVINATGKTKSGIPATGTFVLPALK